MATECWAKLGVTGESRLLTLLFEPHSDCLVAQFYREVSDHHHVKSLYLRGVHDRIYRRLTEKSEVLSYDKALTSPGGPFLLVNVWMARKDFEEYGGYDWFALQLCRLPDGEVVNEIKDGELTGDVVSHRMWVSELHGMATDGNTVYCTVGRPEKGEHDSEKIAYHVAELDLEHASLKLITTLEDCFL